MLQAGDFEIVDIGALITPTKGGRKVSQYIRILSKPPKKIRKKKQCRQI